MDHATKTRIDGMVDEVKGDAKSVVGKVTGDTDTQAEGETESAVGKIKQGAADLTDKASDLVDKAKRQVSDRT